jgi:hypothetical protein
MFTSSFFRYHRQFIDAAKERYFRNLNFKSAIHHNMAEYFMGLWGGGTPKPFEYSELQRQRFHLADTKGLADRKVATLLVVLVVSVLVLAGLHSMKRPMIHGVKLGFH